MTERDSTGYTQPLIPGVTISAEAAASVPTSHTDPMTVASAVLWLLLGVLLFLPGARRA